MNRRNILLLLDAIDKSDPASVRFSRREEGCGTIDDIIKRLILADQTIEDGPNPPSPAEWLGLDYDEARKLLEMRPSADHCPDTDLDGPAAMLRSNFDSYPAPLRQRVYIDLLAVALNSGAIDWRRAYQINDLEVSS